MKKLIVLMIVMMMAFSVCATPLLQSTVSGNKDSPPEITLASNLLAVMSEFVELSAELSVTALPVTWEFNNSVTTNKKFAANTANLQASEFFMGAGDRFVSGEITGLTQLSQNMNMKNSRSDAENSASMQTLKFFLGPGDRFVSGSITTGLTQLSQNQIAMTRAPKNSMLKRFLGPGDRFMSGKLAGLNNLSSQSQNCYVA
jgi:hypothetical protein